MVNCFLVQEDDGLTLIDTGVAGWSRGRERAEIEKSEARASRGRPRQDDWISSSGHGSSYWIGLSPMRENARL